MQDAGDDVPLRVHSIYEILEYECAHLDDVYSAITNIPTNKNRYFCNSVNGFQKNFEATYRKLLLDSIKIFKVSIMRSNFFTKIFSILGRFSSLFIK